MNSELSNRMNNFFRDSMSLIDETDIGREFSKAQIKYGKRLFKDDLEINSIECQIAKFNDKTNKILESIESKRAEFAKIEKPLNKFCGSKKA